MIRPLGAGGMAEVWLARNPNMKRPFAIKFILPQLAANREIQARFRDEAWRQSGLHHPNIV
jgi:serine/threonine protein kinase